jgi:regulator of RNase E activity RraA
MTNPYEYDLPVDELIARYHKTYTSAVYDVLDKRGMPNQALAVDIKPVKLEWKLAGPAFTMKGVSDPTGNEELRQRRILMFEAMKATGVPIIDVRDCSFDMQVAHYGEMNATVGASCGVIGAIVDGGSRDTQFLIDRDFPIFARYLSPVEALMRWTYYDWQIPISLRGALSSTVPVSPGDFMVGDLDGVVVVPKDEVVSVLLETEELIEHENVVRAEFASGVDPVGTYQRHALL